jgi:hypothetical protein
MMSVKMKNDATTEIDEEFAWKNGHGGLIKDQI